MLLTSSSRSTGRPFGRPHALLAVLAVMGLLAALLLTVAPRAHAESDRATDAKRDVGTLTYPEARAGGLLRTSGAPAAPQAGDATLDITTFRSSYATDRITFQIGVRRLAKANYQAVGYITVGTTGKYGLAYVTQDSDGVVVLFERGGGSIPCEGLRAIANRETDVVRLSMPASCIDDPSAIRTGALMGRDVEGGLRVDDARSPRTPRFGGEPTVGKRLRED